MEVDDRRARRKPSTPAVSAMDETRPGRPRGMIPPSRRDDRGSPCSRSAPRRHRAAAPAPAAVDCRARSCRHRRRSTTADARTADHRAAARIPTRRTNGESYWPIRIIGFEVPCPSPLVIAGLDPAIHPLRKSLVRRWIRGSSPRMTRWLVWCPGRSAARSTCEAVRCRAGAVTNAGAWYGPGSAERHEECRTASGTRVGQ
jgi:hypothetical protein